MKTITPSEGMRLYNTESETVYEGAIYVPDIFDNGILIEISEEEYQSIIKKQQEPLPQYEERLLAVEKKAEYTAVAVEEIIEILIGDEE